MALTPRNRPGTTVRTEDSPRARDTPRHTRGSKGLGDQGIARSEGADAGTRTRNRPITSALDPMRESVGQCPPVTI